ncbi:hypothetical protein [Streptomyces sp. NBC_00525]|uniref:hypothetical protein n=1 Tax=Streptomyces sp. NBC_00525 TaxID=2903660 RepID=UPI002E816424|nr:hypothetical protein [Streptomyces sp. NBC_00525]WUC94722.1 hypothetical protein OG710_14560 [Streptomyces sp. NBC_00525]
MSRVPRKGFRFNPVHLAGWLFADMLLVLALVSMGDRGDPLAAEASGASPRPSASTSATAPKPKPSPTGPRSVERKPVKFEVTASAGDTDAMVSQLTRKTARYKGRTAAFVITFGNAPETGVGQAYAEEINKALKVARPTMFRGATPRNFWSKGSTGSADLEIYFFTR